MNLINACSMNYTDIVIYLIQNGADINIKDVYGNNCLLLVSRNGNLDLVKLFIEKNVDVNHKNNIGWTSLIMACVYGNLDVILYLLTISNIETEIKGRHFTEYLYYRIKHKFIQDYNMILSLKCPWCLKQTFCDTNRKYIIQECNICYDEKPCYIFNCFHTHMCCKYCLSKIYTS